jgi:hypothetical protein
VSLDNPYRAAGAFRGKAYIRRDADAKLLEQIEDNQYYPYFAAPRQSGKSSLLIRTMAGLDRQTYRCALVDLSPFVVTSYEDFWRQFLFEVARSANFDPAPIGQEDPRDVFLLWLRGCEQRLIVFIDEIDVLLTVDVREQIFSKFRTFFNMRARPDTAELERLQFVLAGAAHSSRFIKDPRWSPFNVAIEIELEDLSPAQVSQLAAYLGTAGAFAGPDLTQRVFELTGGSVYLCQLVFEQLWNAAARGKQRLAAADVDAVVASVVAESPRNIHFYNIFRLVTADPRLQMLFRRLTEGHELAPEEHKELRLTGICRGASPFRNEVYARVFGPGGPLDLKVGDKQIALGKQLDEALARRDRLRVEASEAVALEAAEAEIRRLRREFREGAALQVGDVLGRGRFRLAEKIGQGGFAAVWRAHDEKLGRTVALKVLHGQFAEDKTRRERFFRGAWKMSELRHPGIVEVIEPYGDENGHYYFAMEFLAGGTLHEAVLDHRVPRDQVLRRIAQVGRALHFAHERGLVHRDVKPSNVLLAGEDAKLTDFDLVRETDITGNTRTGAMGTFIYAAPDVMARPQDADARADIYGLGMTAVFALHGADLPMDVIRDADRFIDRLRCGAVVHDVLKKAVAWDREHRFASAAEFVAALERVDEDEAKAAMDATMRTVLPPLTTGARAKAAAAMPARAPPAADAFAAADEDERGADVTATRDTAPTAAATLTRGVLPLAETSAILPVPFAPVVTASPTPAPTRSAAPVVTAGPTRSAAPAAAPAVTTGPTRSAAAAVAAAPGPPIAPAARIPAGAAVGPGQVTAEAERQETGRARGRELSVAHMLADDDVAGVEEEVSRTSAGAQDDGPAYVAMASEVVPVAQVPGDRDVATDRVVAMRPESSAARPGDDATALAVVPVAQAGSVAGPRADAGGRDVPVVAGEVAARRGLATVELEPSRRESTGAVARAAPAPASKTATGSPEAPLPATPTRRGVLPAFLTGIAASLALVFLAQRLVGAPEVSTLRLPEERDEGGSSRIVVPSAPARQDILPPSVEPHDTAKPEAVSGARAEDGTATTTAPTSDDGPTGDEAGTTGAVQSPPTKAGPTLEQLVDAGCDQVRYGDAGKGVALLLAARERAPRHKQTLLCLADGYAKQDRQFEALNYYQQVLSQYRRDRRALLGSAMANESLGRRDLAAYYYREVLKYEPGNRSAEAFFRGQGAAGGGQP